IKQWDICRNLKAAEKDQLALEDEACLSQGVHPPSRVVHQRPLRRDKLQRHIRNRDKLARIRNEAEKSSKLPRSTDNSSLELAGWQWTTPESGLQLDDAEIGLHVVKAWHEWYFCKQSRSGLALQQIDSTQEGAMDTNPRNWPNFVEDGILYIQNGYRIN